MYAGGCCESEQEPATHAQGERSRGAYAYLHFICYASLSGIAGYFCSCILNPNSTVGAAAPLLVALVSQLLPSQNTPHAKVLCNTNSAWNRTSVLVSMVGVGALYVQPVRRGEHQGGKPACVGERLCLRALRRLPRYPQAHWCACAASSLSLIRYAIWREAGTGAKQCRTLRC